MVAIKAVQSSQGGTFARFRELDFFLVPRVVSLGELKKRADELVKSVADSQVPVVIEDGERLVAVLAPGPRAAEVALPEWREWLEHSGDTLASLGWAGATRPDRSQAEVDKALLGFDPGTGQVGSRGGREFLGSELQRVGVPVSDEAVLDSLYARVLELCESKDRIFEEDLKLLAHEAMAEAPQRLRLLSLTVQSSTGIPAVAEVTLELSHGPAMRREHGDGPLHAAFRAIEKLVGLEPEVENFAVVSATRGEDAIAEATIHLSQEGRVVIGHGASTNAVEAGVHAYLNALNFLMEARRGETQAPQA